MYVFSMWYTYKEELIGECRLRLGETFLVWQSPSTLPPLPYLVSELEIGDLELFDLNS